MVGKEEITAIQSAVVCMRDSKLVLLEECRECKHHKESATILTKDKDLMGIVRCSFVHDIAMKELTHNG